MFPLTSPPYRDYSFAQVLNTPLEAESSAPDSRGFFTPIVFNGRVVGNDKIPMRIGKVASRLLAVLKYPVALSTRVKFNKSRRRPIMAAQSKSTSARRKSKSVSPIATPANVSHIDPERRKGYALRDWYEEFSDFLRPLQDNEFALVQKTVLLILKKPERKKPEKSEVIKFSARKNNL
ncbi:hypothetical protein [Nitrosomonas ureae]|nr:hypothetical protein [Nitrosomonas ureae]